MTAKTSVLFSTLLLSLITSHLCPASLIPDSVAIGSGTSLGSKTDLLSHHGELRWMWWQSHQDKSMNWRLASYNALGIHYWKSQLNQHSYSSSQGAQKAYAISFSPVVRLFFTGGKWLRPFSDIGLGISYQTEKDLQQKVVSPINMGGHLQFEFRMMLGTYLGASQQYEVACGWLHYSNANLHTHNEGLNFMVLRAGIWW